MNEKLEKYPKSAKELHEYLLSIKEMCVADKYAGFAFLDERQKP